MNPPGQSKTEALYTVMLHIYILFCIEHITRLHLNDISGQTKKPQECAISCCVFPAIIIYACTTCASQLI